MMTYIYDSSTIHRVPYHIWYCHCPKNPLFSAYLLPPPGLSRKFIKNIVVFQINLIYVPQTECTFCFLPRALQQVLISCLFYTWSQLCIYIIPNLPTHPIPFPFLVIHMFVLYICFSISALQIGPSVPFF